MRGSRIFYGRSTGGDVYIGSFTLIELRYYQPRARPAIRFSIRSTPLKLRSFRSYTTRSMRGLLVPLSSDQQGRASLQKKHVVTRGSLGWVCKKEHTYCKPHLARATLLLAESRTRHPLPHPPDSLGEKRTSGCLQQPLEARPHSSNSEPRYIPNNCCPRYLLGFVATPFR